MNKKLLWDALGWGTILWLVGYILGIVFFFFVSPALIGWVIMPIGILLTLWVLLKEVKGTTLTYFLTLSVVWTILAVLLDYYLLVQLFHPKDGYYKLDVYLYYAVNLVLPVTAYFIKAKKVNSQ
jgi:hypothetical protein